MKLTTEQLKQMIKEELESFQEVLEQDTDVWSMVEELKLSGMTETGIMIELDKFYTSGGGGPDAARQWGQWSMDFGHPHHDYQPSVGDIASWQQQRGIAGLVDDLKQIKAARGAQM